MCPFNSSLFKKNLIFKIRSLDGIRMLKISIKKENLREFLLRASYHNFSSPVMLCMVLKSDQKINRKYQYLTLFWIILFENISSLRFRFAIMYYLHFILSFHRFTNSFSFSLTDGSSCQKNSKVRFKAPPISRTLN